MLTENVFIAHPTTPEQITALKAVVKKLRVKFEIQKKSSTVFKEPSKTQTLANIKRGFKELKLIQQGKLKTTSAKDFLDEL